MLSSILMQDILNGIVYILRVITFVTISWSLWDMEVHQHKIKQIKLKLASSHLNLWSLGNSWLYKHQTSRFIQISANTHFYPCKKSHILKQTYTFQLYVCLSMYELSVDRRHFRVKHEHCVKFNNRCLPDSKILKKGFRKVFNVREKSHFSNLNVCRWFLNRYK